MKVCLDMPTGTRDKIWTHLSPNPASTEEAGFGLARFVSNDSECQFSLFQWMALTDSDFLYKDSDYLHMTDEARVRIIKAAHSNDACLVEFHSHPFPCDAEFSFADRNGFKEFVPQIWWRLKQKPYLAVVVGPENFDGLAWLQDPESPIALNEINDGEVAEKATGLSIISWR